MEACDQIAIFGIFLQVRALAKADSFQFSRQQKQACDSAGHVLRRSVAAKPAAI
jgi:hypothetical protein